MLIGAALSGLPPIPGTGSAASGVGNVGSTVGGAVTSGVLDPLEALVQKIADAIPGYSLAAARAVAEEMCDGLTGKECSDLPIGFITRVATIADWWEASWLPDPVRAFVAARWLLSGQDGTDDFAKEIEDHLAWKIAACGSLVSSVLALIVALIVGFVAAQIITPLLLSRVLHRLNKIAGKRGEIAPVDPPGVPVVIVVVWICTSLTISVGISIAGYLWIGIPVHAWLVQLGLCALLGAIIAVFVMASRCCGIVLGDALKCSLFWTIWVSGYVLGMSNVPGVFLNCFFFEDEGFSTWKTVLIALAIVPITGLMIGTSGLLTYAGLVRYIRGILVWAPGLGYVEDHDARYKDLPDAFELTKPLKVWNPRKTPVRRLVGWACCPSPQGYAKLESSEYQDAVETAAASGTHATRSWTASAVAPQGDCLRVAGHIVWALSPLGAPALLYSGGGARLGLNRDGRTIENIYRYLSETLALHAALRTCGGVEALTATVPQPQYDGERARDGEGVIRTSEVVIPMRHHRRRFFDDDTDEIDQVEIPILLDPIPP
jgi:hypothetical protein